MADPTGKIEPTVTGRLPPPKPSPVRWAIIVSIAFHILLVACLLAWYLPRQSPTDNRTMTDQSQTRTSPPSPVQAEDIPAENVPAEQIESSLRSAIESTATISEERKLSELERNVQQLEQIASESSITEVSEAIRLATALEDRASAPATEAVGGAFDFDTAQFHDVLRETDQGGKWVYRSILLDAKGRTVEVELTESEGKTAYETMQMVKASPFAEAVYRSMVMPMLDKLIPKTVPTLQSPVTPSPNPSAEAEETP